MKKLLISSIIILIALLSFTVFRRIRKEPEATPQSDAPDIQNFEECQELGYMILEPYPRKCQTPSGKTFVESAVPFIEKSPPSSLPPASVSPGTVQKGSYSSRTKTSTYTLYTAGQNDPIFVFIHGGGWRAGDKDENKFIADLTEVRNSGFNVYTINYRLSGDAKWPAQINDVKCMFAFLAQSPDAFGDKNRIVVGGNSAGAHLALMAAFTKKDEFDDDCEWRSRDYRIVGVAAFSPAIDLTQMSKEGLSAVEGLLGYHPTANTSGALAASPLSYATADDPSILILSGGRDGLTRATENARRLVEAFRKVGKTIQWQDYPDLGHSLNFTDPSGAVFQRFLSFISEFK